MKKSKSRKIITAGSDFSRKTLIARIDNGFKDAMTFLKKSAR